MLKIKIGNHTLQFDSLLDDSYIKLVDDLTSEKINQDLACKVLECDLFENEINQMILNYSDIEIGTLISECIEVINYRDYDEELVCAYIEYQGAYNASTQYFSDLVWDLNKHWNLISCVQTYEELGRYFVYDLELINLDSDVASYFDFESYGKDMEASTDGCLTSFGYLYQN